MKKGIPIFSFAIILILALIISCDGTTVKGTKQTLELALDLTQDLEEYLSKINEKYYAFATEEGRYTEQEFLNRYDIHTYPELGTLDDPAPVNDITFGTTSFKSSDDVTLQMGESAYLVDKAYVQNGSFINAPAPVVMLELLTTDPVIKVNEESYKPDDFPAAAEDKVIKAFWNDTELAELHEDSYTVKDDNLSPEKFLKFSFSDKYDYFITKSTYYSGKDIVRCVYSFLKSDNGALKIYPGKDAEKPFDSVIYQICMPDAKGNYHRKTISIHFEQ